MSSDGIVYGGTYANGIVLSNPATQNPATIAATGIVTKQGAFGVAAKYNTAISSEPVTAWSITNYGIIEGLGVNSAGISLAAGSSIDNIGTAALIAGYQDAILISSDAGTISNSGMIEATGSFTNAITLAAGGTVTNTHGAVINAPILIQDGAGTVANSGSLGRGSPALEVSISGGAGVVTNSDVITGGVSLGAGGSVTNADGAAISGGSEIELGGFLLNVPAVDISGGAGTVANSGFLGHGVELHAGGSLTNAEGAVISVGVPSTYHQSQNLVGVSVYGSPGTIVNVGTIESLGGGYRDGVYLGSGGIVTNSGTIAGHHGGILVEGAASTLFNDGRIAATGSYGIGVYLGSVGNTLVNDGRIAATGSYGTGVYIRSDGDTLVNAGRIGSAGGTAVYLAGGYNDLVVQQGAVFVGKVEAAGSYDTLELAGSRGRLDGLGTKFSGFYNVVVDPGAVWTLSGSAPAIDDDGTLVAKGNDLTLGQIVSDPGDKGHITVDGTATFAGAVGAQELVFNAAGTMRLDHPLTFKGTITEFDTIDLVNQAANGFSFAHHRVSDRLSVTENGATVADLHLRGYGGYASADFTLSSDGHSGTDITFTPPPIIGL